MKNSLGKKASLFMIMVLILTPLLWLQGKSIAFAAAPAFAETKVEIIGEDETYQLGIKNMVTGSKYKWSSSNTKVARVSSKGLVTTVGKGTASIKCKITFPDKKTKTITSKITVTIPATKVKINNATEVNGAHILLVGEKFNFNRDIFPSGSSDKTYWSLGGGDISSIKVTNSSSGIVQALKPGKVILVATAAKTANAEEAAKSFINDAIIIEVVAPSATVGSVDIVDSTVIKAVFDSPIDEKTVIGQKNTLENIDISLKKNIKGVLAADPGNITAQLSSDKKTLTISSTNRFEGEYGINFSDKIKTTEGINITGHYQLISYVDNVPPTLLRTDMDDTGMRAIITFNEAIDFSGLRVAGGGLVPGQSTIPAGRETVEILNTRSNYISSKDMRSLTIDLSNIAYTDHNKLLTVTLSGIKDMSGNSPANYTIPIMIRTDNTPKPQAKLGIVIRSSYNTLTATFDRTILSGGYANINNGPYMYGEVDAQDPKKVHYTINESDALKTGIQTVAIRGWQAYNVNPNDTSSNQQQTRNVPFDVDKTNPNLLTYEFDSETNILTLTYNKEVALTYVTGTFYASLVTISDEIRPSNNLVYTAMTSEDPKVIKLQINNLAYLGSYTFILDQYFVRDNYRNYGLPRTITISNIDGVNLMLPDPYKVEQSPTDPSQVVIEFTTMLDKPSAENINNYSIAGVTILSAKLEKNTKLDGSRVVLTIASGSIDIEMLRPLKINGVGSYNGNYTPITDYSTEILLKDNVKPYFIGPLEFNKNYLNEIRLNFSEKITGTMVVKVTQLGDIYNNIIGNTVTVDGTAVIITLSNPPDNNKPLKVEILERSIVDLSGNELAAMDSLQMVYVTY